MATKKNVGAGKDKWFLLLLNDNDRFTKTAKVLAPFMEGAIKEAGDIGSKNQALLRRVFRQLAPIAAEIYLGSILKTRKYGFDVYFGWYLREAVNKFDSKTGEIKSDLLRQLLDKYSSCECGEDHHHHH